MKEGVISNDKKERGEGAPLLHPPKDVNPVQQVPPKKGRNLDGMERPFNKVPKPQREADPFENVPDPIMVDRVKSLGRVEKKKDATKLLSDSFEKQFVDGNDVLPTVLPGQKALLRGVDVSTDSRHDTAGDRRGQDPVIRVGHTKRAGVRDKTRVLLREKEKQPMIKALRGGVPLGNGLKNPDKHRTRKLGGRPPSGKGNPIRAGGGVVRTINDLSDKGKVGTSAEGKINLLPVAEKELVPLPLRDRRTLSPHPRPVLTSQSGLARRGNSRNVVRGEPKRNQLGPRAGKPVGEDTKDVGGLRLGGKRGRGHTITSSPLKPGGDPTRAVETH